MKFSVRDKRHIALLVAFLSTCILTAVYFILGQHASNLHKEKLKSISLGYIPFSRRINMTNKSYIAHQSQKKQFNLSKVEVRHIAFLKVHKCASSTAQNIFLRFGYRRNLTFVFGKPSEHQPYENVISYTGTLNESNILPPPENKTFDILCCHVFYNQAAFQKYMPADTVYIGIVRDPFEHFLSSMKYFRRDLLIRLTNKTNDPLMTILKHPKTYRVYNKMSLEYGFPKELLNTYNGTAVLSYLGKLDREFPLVIIVEYFEESLVLLRRFLNWGLKDILFNVQNISKMKNLRLYITPEQRKYYYSLAKTDTALYQFFFKRLWSQVQAEGEDFFEELLLFQRIKKNVDRFCSKEYKGQRPLVILESRWGEEFNVTEEDCQLMFCPETRFVKLLKKMQYKSESVSV